MDKALTWFYYGWMALALLVNAIAIIGLFIGAETFWAGVASVQEMYSPFNVLNFIMEVVLVSPAIGAYFWREHRRKTKKSN